MRVISGSRGGLRLFAPTGTATRPTSDRVKEAMFSILESDGILPEAKVLDLFAGSGALAIEALSRGASHATLIEKSRQALDTISKNLKHTAFEDKATVLCQDLFTPLDRFSRQGSLFDLILLDPPYAAGIHEKTILLSAPLLQPEGILVAETSSKLPLPETIANLRRTSRRVYGDTALEFFQPEQNDAP